MERENQRVALSKRLLKEALLGLLEEKPIEAISITELCRRAEINRATFYRHYSVPRDLLLEIQRDLIRDFQRRTARPDSREAAAEYLTAFCTYVYQRRQVVELLLQSRSDMDMAGFFTDFCGTFLLPAAERTAGKLDSDSVELISGCLAGGGYCLVRQWLLGNSQKTPEEIAALILSLFNLDFVRRWADSVPRG